MQLLQSSGCQCRHAAGLRGLRHPISRLQLCRLCSQLLGHTRSSTGFFSWKQVQRCPKVRCAALEWSVVVSSCDAFGSSCLWVINFPHFRAVVNCRHPLTELPAVSAAMSGSSVPVSFATGGGPSGKEPQAIRRPCDSRFTLRRSAKAWCNQRPVNSVNGGGQ